MFCSNCGNSISTKDRNTLFCYRCFYSTSIYSDYEDEIVCPCCHRLVGQRDVRCRHCGISIVEYTTNAIVSNDDYKQKPYDG